MHWSPFLAVLWREIRRFMRVLFQTVVTPLINSTLYLLIFGVSMGRGLEAPQGLSYLAFLVPGLTMMTALNNAFQNASGCIVTAKFTGELEDFRTSPLSKTQMLWGLGFGAVVRGCTVAAVTFAVGEAFHYQMHGAWIWPSHPGYLLFFIVAGTLQFGFLGIWLALWAKGFDQLSGIGAFILMPLLYLGGVFFSIEDLPGFWQSAAKANPVLYLINGVRYGILSYTDVSVSGAIGIAVLALLVMYALAFHALVKGSFERW
ncbi:MAG: ABC transporter permease [Chlamydiia bacterium]|nr:ABC transporter permease [Chlamydiia bacterium]